MAQNPNIGREILPTLSEGTTPNKPFCTYMSCGAIHAPPEWIEKYRGKCNKGWDAVRAEVQAGRKTTGTLLVNGSVVAEERIDKTVPFIFSADETNACRGQTRSD